MKKTLLIVLFALFYIKNSYPEISKAFEVKANVRIAKAILQLKALDFGTIYITGKREQTVELNSDDTITSTDPSILGGGHSIGTYLVTGGRPNQNINVQITQTQLKHGYTTLNTVLFLEKSAIKFGSNGVALIKVFGNVKIPIFAQAGKYEGTFYIIVDF